jgi:hypothetical protein
MAGLVPVIHAFATASKTWMRGTSPRMTAYEKVYASGIDLWARGSSRWRC